MRETRQSYMYLTTGPYETTIPDHCILASITTTVYCMLNILVHAKCADAKKN